MRTEVLEVPKLEFIPVPAETLEPCTVPMPPQDGLGSILYKDLPSYLVVVLGAFEECNIQLDKIRELMEDDAQAG